MKKTLIIAGLAAAALALVSCQKVQEVQPEDSSAAQEENVVEAGTGETVFTLLATAPETDPETGEPVSAPGVRTSLSGLDVSWKVGDKIRVNGIESKPLAADKIKSPTSAEFEFDQEVTAPFEAVYPSEAYEADSYASGSARMSLPSTQTYEAGNFDPAAAVMIGTGTSGVAFHHAVAYLKLSFDQPVKSVRVMANDGTRVAGRMDVDFGTLAMTDHYASSKEYNTVTLDCGSGAAANDPLVIAIPARSYPEGLNIFVVTTDNKYQIVRTGAVDLSTKAGVIAPQSKSLNKLAAYSGPGIYSHTDWKSFVCADESKFTTDTYRQGNSDAWKGEDGEINIYSDFTVATNIQRHGSNGAQFEGAENNIYFLETLDGNGHTLTQNASTVPLVAWLGSASESGTIKNLTLAGSCTELGTWGNAAFAVRIFRNGTLDHCENKINTVYEETEAAHSALYFGGLAISNGGMISDCTNSGNMDITILCDAQRIFNLGGVATANRYDNACGDFVRCENTGNLTVVKNASGDEKQSLVNCSIAGICGNVVQGEPGTAYTGVYSRFVNCVNSGNITFWEEKSGVSSGTQLAAGIGGIIGMATKYNAECPYVGANDSGYYFILDGGHNIGTIDVSSGNTAQPLANNMTGARQTYIGGLVGFAMGSNNPNTATNADYYPIIRGYNDSTIKLGSEGGSEAAGGLVGGGGFLKFEYLSNSTTVYEKSANPGRTPVKVGGVSPMIGWVVKRCIAVPTSIITLKMDASGLNGLTVFGQGIGVTGNVSKNAAGAIDGTNKAPLIIFEKYNTNYYNLAIKYADESTEPAASLAKGYQAASKTFYGKATTSGTYLRDAGYVKFVAFE
ncbi:MAG: hypothetical protein J6Y31_04655 [Bacteroidales bacterium]|nr:hypothetical protein [Bacteroidales bacterium]